MQHDLKQVSSLSISPDGQFGSWRTSSLFDRVETAAVIIRSTYVGVMVSILIPMKRFFTDLTSERQVSYCTFSRTSSDVRPPVRLTFAVFVHRVVEEASDPVRGNREGDSCCDLQRVDADHLPVLTYTHTGQLYISTAEVDNRGLIEASSTDVIMKFSM